MIRNRLICIGLLAGSERFTGAAMLATGGAVRGGAGMVRLVTAQRAADAVRLEYPEVVVVPIATGTRDGGVPNGGVPNGGRPGGQGSGGPCKPGVQRRKEQDEAKENDDQDGEVTKEIGGYPCGLHEECDN